MTSSISLILIVFFLAGMGAILRHYLAVTLNSETFPYGIFIANIFGSFLMGIFYSFPQTFSLITPQVKLAVMVGFLGALTTFSSYSLDILNLIDKGQLLVATLYFFLTNSLALIFCFIGLRIGRAL